LLMTAWSAVDAYMTGFASSRRWRCRSVNGLLGEQPTRERPGGVAVRLLAVATACVLPFTCVFLLHPASSFAADWASCPDVRTADSAGTAVGAVGVEASGVDCGVVEQVVREFYAQPIGSSGAAYAHGFGCAYGGGGKSVECGPGASGDDGPERIRWREQRKPAVTGAPVERTCGTLPGDGAYS
jgi:hypothetical protein